MILGNKIIVSYFYGINPAQAENPISFLLCFRDLNDVIKIWKNTGVIILEGGRRRSEGIKQTEAGGPKGGGPRGQCRVGPTILALEAPQPSIFSPPPSSWPKNAYKRSPTAFSKTSAAISQKHEIEDLELQIGGGKLRRGAAGVVSTLSIDISTVYMMKRE